jgi:hypothetical protein
MAQFEVASYQSDQGNLREAIQGFRRTVELDATHNEASRRLVWLLAASDDDELRDGPESLRLARLLVTRYPNAAQTLDALAAAQAECADFATAKKTVHIAIVKSLQRGGDTHALQQRLSLYRQCKPYRMGKDAL